MNVIWALLRPQNVNNFPKPTVGLEPARARSLVRTTLERRRRDEGLLRGYTSDRSLGPRGSGGNARPRILSALGAGTLESFRMLSQNGSTKKHSNVSKELWQPQCQGPAGALLMLFGGTELRCRPEGGGGRHAPLQCARCPSTLCRASRADQ